LVLVLTIDNNRERSGQIRLRLTHQVVQSIVSGTDTDKFIRVEVIVVLGRADDGAGEHILVVGTVAVGNTKGTRGGGVSIVTVPDVVTIVHQPLLSNLAATLILASKGIRSSKESNHQQNSRKHFHLLSNNNNNKKGEEGIKIKEKGSLSLEEEEVWEEEEEEGRGGRRRCGTQQKKMWRK